MSISSKPSPTRIQRRHKYVPSAANDNFPPGMGDNMRAEILGRLCDRFNRLEHVWRKGFFAYGVVGTLVVSQKQLLSPLFQTAYFPKGTVAEVLSEVLPSLEGFNPMQSFHVTVLYDLDDVMLNEECYKGMFLFECEAENRN